ncbi:MAG: transglutaminase family protein [Bacteroidetes bacterium]|nr:transglutaminase family protein [Bacteroidota bacterium]
MISPNELNALISLLDDPDEEVFLQIKSKLLSLGIDVIPVLEHAWENSFDNILQSRIEIIIHNIQFEEILAQISKWSKDDQNHLLEGVLLVARYQYPDLDEVKLKKQIDQIRQDVWLELNDNLTALEKVKILNHIIFDVHNFSGNTTNYHAPQNSYINTVLESKKGNPLSLSILYSVIAQSLGLPIYGVNLPEHFILAYLNVDNHLHQDENGEVEKILFYINPFSKGTVFGRKEIDAFLKQLNLKSSESFYMPCTNTDMVKRLLRNLINSYERLGYIPKKEELEAILKVVEEAK